MLRLCRVLAYFSVRFESHVSGFQLHAGFGAKDWLVSLDTPMDLSARHFSVARLSRPDGAASKEQGTRPCRTFPKSHNYTSHTNVRPAGVSG